MKSANIGDLKARLSAFLAEVERGEEIQVCKRNVPFARIVPTMPGRPNRTQLGWARGTVHVECDLTEPAIPPDDWDMLGERADGDDGRTA